jgi:uncharacterized damage-inducible protein DinB
MERRPASCDNGPAVDPEDIRLLYAYNRWANARVLAAAAQLTAEQFTRELGGSFASVRDTLVHILSAEWIWLMRWKGSSPKALFEAAQFSTLEALRARWAEVEAEQADFVARVTAESLRALIDYLNTRGESWRYPLGRMLQHVVNHSSYHRGQVITLLRQLGAAAVSSDYLLYFDDLAGRA